MQTFCKPLQFDLLNMSKPAVFDSLLENTSLLISLFCQSKKIAFNIFGSPLMWKIAKSF